MKPPRRLDRSESFEKKGLNSITGPVRCSRTGRERSGKNLFRRNILHVFRPGVRESSKLVSEHVGERVEAPSGPGLRRWTAAAALLVVLTAPIGVARRPLAAGDEAREAAIVQNMLSTGDWRKNLVGGEVLYEKPPFFYMSVAAAARTTGSLSPLSARLPSVFFAALALGATAWAGGALFSRRAGIVAMLLLATTYLFLVNAHNCLIDVPVLGFVTLGLAAFVARQRRGAPRWDGWWGLAAAGALLAQGLIGPTLLILLTLPFWWFSAERRPLRRSVSTGALAVPLAALALWIGVTWSALGGHGVYEALWVNNVGRFLGFAEPGYAHHKASFSNYLPLLPGLVFPWTPLLAGALARAWTRDGRRSLRPLASGLLAALLLLSVAGKVVALYRTRTR
jgi:4-amino-4-deoxy-L-arabinose transferase-like glycosyltransferase